ncbi:hypothetical protein [Oceanobacillus sp. Castelsardo]|uniref:hypothetical protein n=1 Tax=Oceanobacillus sp. Castelsardo TaxID=1851204 RepID=UPI000839523F|nr:hypothetical protein [Oceanobacillus sp. Castelsardo]
MRPPSVDEMMKLGKEVSSNNKPMTTEEMNKMLEEENHKLNEEIKVVTLELHQAESEALQYKTAFKMLVKEISKEK